MVLNAPASDIKSCAGAPKKPSILLKTPVLKSKKELSIATITTTDIKYGAYETICKVFLYALFPTLFKPSANRIGNGNPTISEYKLIENVFHKISPNALLLKK